MAEHPILFTIAFTQEMYNDLFKACKGQSVQDLIRDILEEYLREKRPE